MVFIFHYSNLYHLEAFTSQKFTRNLTHSTLCSHCFTSFFLSCHHYFKNHSSVPEVGYKENSMEETSKYGSNTCLKQN